MSELFKTVPDARILEKGDKGKKIPVKIPLSGNEKIIYQLMDMYPKKTDELMSQSGLSLQSVHDAVLKLRLKGLVDECGKNNYVRKKL